MIPMFCSKCGASNNPESLFCANCGNRQAQPTTETPVTQAPVQIQPNISSSPSPVIPAQTNALNKIKLFFDTHHDLQKIIVVLSVIILCVLLSAIGTGINRGVFINTCNDSSCAQTNTTETIEKPTTGKYRTAIEFDRTYEVSTINNREDTLKLINEDSTSQKKACTNNEILKIEQSIIEKYKITAVNLCEMSVGFASEVENVVKTIYETYPNAKNYLTNLTLTNTGMNNDYVAVFMGLHQISSSKTDTTMPWAFRTTIGMNSKYFLNETKLEKAVKQSSDAGHFPKNTTKYSPVAHEFGHFLSYLTLYAKSGFDSLNVRESDNNKLVAMSANWGNGKSSQSIINEAYQNYSKTNKQFSSELEFRSSISKYAVAKDDSGSYIYDETIAEAFHDYYLNKNNSAPASIAIVDVLSKYIKALK